MSEILGKYIKKRRKELHLTQIELAEKAGVGKRFIRELEAGKNTVMLDKVEQVLKLLGDTLYPVPINKLDKFKVSD